MAGIRINDSKLALNKGGTSKFTLAVAVAVAATLVTSQVMCESYIIIHSQSAKWSVL